MVDAPSLFLMLIKVSDSVNQDTRLAGWIQEIEDDYMKRYEHLGRSVAHLSMAGGPWHFALLFPGSAESVGFLKNEIEQRAPQGDVEVLTMEATDLDDFRAARQAQ